MVPAPDAIDARAIAALTPLNICTLDDVGPDYLVMELTEGPTLADRSRGPLPRGRRDGREILFIA